MFFLVSVSCAASLFSAGQEIKTIDLIDLRAGIHVVAFAVPRYVRTSEVTNGP